MSVAFFDLDRTLLDCNSARLWLVDETRGGRVRARTAAWAMWYMVQYTLGRTGLDPVFRQAAALLEGMEEAELSERMSLWFQRRIVERVRPGAQAVLDAHREAGDKLVVATSSSYLIAKLAAEQWDLDDSIGTEFEVLDGRFTGEITSMAFGDAKAERIREWLDRQNSGGAIGDCAFYSDSLSDLAAMEAAGRAVAVNPDHKLRKLAVKHGWEITDWGRSAESRKQAKKAEKLARKQAKREAKQAKRDAKKAKKAEKRAAKEAADRPPA